MMQINYNIGDEVFYMGIPGVIDYIGNNGNLKIRTNDGLMEVNQSDLGHIQLVKPVISVTSAGPTVEIPIVKSQKKNQKNLKWIFTRALLLSILPGVLNLISGSYSGNTILDIAFVIGSIISFLLFSVIISAITAIIRMIFINENFKNSFLNVVWIVIVLLTILSTLGSLANLIEYYG